MTNARVAESGNAPVLSLPQELINDATGKPVPFGALGFKSLPWRLSLQRQVGYIAIPKDLNSNMFIISSWIWN